MVELPDYTSRTSPSQVGELVPGFNLDWYSLFTGIVNSGETKTFTGWIDDDEFIHYVDGIYAVGSVSQFHTMYATVNDQGIGVVGFTTSNWLSVRNNPSVYMILGDHLDIVVYNAGPAASTVTIHVVGTKIPRPDGFGRPPRALYTAAPLIADVITPIQFTDGSTYSPTKWEWYPDCVNLGPITQNPSYRYPAAGIYSPKLKVTNQYGYDTYVRSSYIDVREYCYMPAFTKVNPGAILTNDHWGATMTGCPCNSNIYIYKDYGADYFSSFRARMAFCLVGTNLGHLGQFFALANAAGSANEDTGGKIILFHYTTAGGEVRTYLGYWENTVHLSEDYYWMPDLSERYVIISKDKASNSVYAYIYSDAAFTNLVDTLIVSHANLINKTFRYVFGPASYNVASAVTATWYIYNIRFQNFTPYV